MSEYLLMKGNYALAEAAIRAGCEGYFAYPITPQSEVGEYMSVHMPEKGRVFLQAESEVAAINMLYGAAGAGFKVMTSSSSPGISLMTEGISYIAGAELPCVIVNVNRGGPGLGTIQPSQGDYFQSTKGGGHGDYRLIVLAPSSVQEIADLTYLAFDLAWKYRNPALILMDGALGQMMEKVKFNPYTEPERDISWATRGKTPDRDTNFITSLWIKPEEMEQVNLRLQAKYKEIEENEVRYDAYNIEDAELILVAFGLSARIASKSMQILRKMGYKVGLIKPITLWPYPYKILQELASNERVKGFFVTELNSGQMVEDVKLGVNGKKEVGFYGRMGGMIYSPEEIVENIIPFCEKTGVKPQEAI